MSTPRSPNNGSMCVLLIGSTLAILVLAWLLANLAFALSEIWSILQGAW
jgi:hypothetical protein